MLNGDLSHISLRSILRLLAEASLSGIVYVEGLDVADDTTGAVGAHACIVLDEGRVCVALLDLRNVRGLSARMVHGGCIDTSRLAELGAGTNGDAMTTAAALVRASAGHDAAGRVVRAHTTETLLWITRAAYARFRFTRSAEPLDWPLPAIELEELFESADAHEAELQALGDPVGDLHRVCSQLPQLPDGDRVSVGADQWRLLSLIDGRRSLLEIVEVSGMGHLATYEHVLELVDQGLVELTEPASPSTLDAMLDALDVLRPDDERTRSVAVARSSPSTDGDRAPTAARFGHGSFDTVPAGVTPAAAGGPVDANAAAAAGGPVDANAAAAAGGASGTDADNEAAPREAAAVDAAPAAHDAGVANDPGAADDANSALLRRLVGRRSGKP